MWRKSKTSAEINSRLTLNKAETACLFCHRVRVNQENGRRFSECLHGFRRDFGSVLAHAELVELDMLELCDAREPQCIRTAFERAAINH